MNQRHFRAFWLISVWLIVCACDLTYGQSTTPQGTPSPEKQAESEYSKTVATLQGIIQSTEALQERLKEREKELKTADTEDQKTKVMGEMNDLTTRLAMLEKDFEGIATSVNLENFLAKPRKSFDWKQEIQDILGPIIEELKRITARPREIERLRNEVAYYEKRLPMVKNAVKNIQFLKEHADTKKLKTQLEDLEKTWTEKEQEISSQRDVARYHLDEKLNEKKPFVESIQNVLRSFFKSRGRNLVLSLLAFVVVFLLLRFLHQPIYKVSPIHKSKERSFNVRLADVIYHILTFIITTSVFLLTVYLWRLGASRTCADLPVRARLGGKTRIAFILGTDQTVAEPQYCSGK